MFKYPGFCFKEMADKIINSDVKNADVVILGAPYDMTSSFGKGADRAPNAIIELLNNQIEQYERNTQLSPTNSLLIAYQNLNGLKKLKPENMVRKIKETFGNLYRQDKFIITLGGEHSITNGPLEAIADKSSPSETSVVQIDAHFDLRPDDSDYNDNPWGKYAHSAVMRRAYEQGFKLVQVGMRSYHESLELKFAEENKIKFFEWGKVNEPSEPEIKDIVKSISTKNVYLTVDVDGFDPSVMPSTGTPVVDGMSWRYGMQLFDKIFDSKNVIAADIVEVIPRLSPDPTAYNAALLLHYLVALKQRDIIKK